MFEKYALEILAILAGLIGMPIITKVKQMLGLDDFKAVLLATVLSFLFGGVAVFLEGGFSFVEVTPDAVAEAFGLVFAVATIFYKALSTKKE